MYVLYETFVNAKMAIHLCHNLSRDVTCLKSSHYMYGTIQKYDGVVEGHMVRKKDT